MSAWEIVVVAWGALLTATTISFLVIVFVSIPLGRAVDRRNARRVETAIRGVGDEAEQWLKENA